MQSQTNQKIGIIGTGMIGSSLAALFCGNGYPTIVLATSPASVEKCRAAFDQIYHVLLERELVTPVQIHRCAQLLSFTMQYEDLATVDFVFECVVEDLALKREIYQKLERHCAQLSALISATSAMSPDLLCEGLQQLKDKLLVAHPFNPPHIVPFVEMVLGESSSQESANRTFELLESCGRKVCVMKKCALGFIANRLQHALLREAFYMVEEGYADPRDIDKALRYSFMPRYTAVGLFEHQDAAGLDMVQSIQNTVYPHLCNRSTAFATVEQKVAAGEVGQKTGRGTYSWTPEAIADFKKRAAEPYWQYFNWNFPIS